MKKNYEKNEVFVQDLKFYGPGESYILWTDIILEKSAKYRYIFINATNI
jgi:hypothetical protein